MSDPLTALPASVDRLAVGSENRTGATDGARLSDRMDDRRHAAHVGSGAVIFQRLLDDSLAGVETPGDAPGGVGRVELQDAGPQAADALVADRALLERLEGLGADERARFRTSLGPMDVDFDLLVACG